MSTRLSSYDRRRCCNMIDREAYNTPNTLVHQRRGPSHIPWVLHKAYTKSHNYEEAKDTKDAVKTNTFGLQIRVLSTWLGGQIAEIGWILGTGIASVPLDGRRSETFAQYSGRTILSFTCGTAEIRAENKEQSYEWES